MKIPAPLADRPSPEFRRCDGAPWPSDDELQADADRAEAAWTDGWADDRWLDVDDVWPIPDADEPTPPDDDGATPLGVEVHRRRRHDGDPARASTATRGRYGLDSEAALARTQTADAAPSSGADRTEAPAAAPSDLDARLSAIELVAIQRHRSAAEEGRLIAEILREAAAHPTPWVGPDPTLDLAWSDPRRRSVDAVRRDRIDLAERAAVAEIAVRLRMSEQTVRTRAAHVEVLQQRCPELWAAFRAGRTSERHAVEAARLAASLPDDRTAWVLFDEGATAAATTLVPTTFAVAARALRERVHAESLEARHQRAARDRGVWMTAELDGMASLTALLPADRARSIMSRLDRAARHLHTAADEERTLAQLRADVLADLATTESGSGAAAQDSRRASSRGEHGPAGQETRRASAPGEHNPAGHETSRTSSRGAHRPAATVVVTVPALTLLGIDDEPATLEGYGPIDLDTARRLAGEAPSWVRLLTHPVTGAPLVLDRQTYRVPVALRRWLGVTSPVCVFPGCNRQARECDIDHLTAWVDGGATDVDNLAPECRHHHRLRHETRWTPEAAPASGALRWTSPLGKTFDSDPPPF